MNDKYITSPYLKWVENKKYDSLKCYNFITNRIHSITKNERKQLLDFSQPRSADYDTVRDLLERKLLFTADQVLDYISPIHAEIETSTICNWRCQYCPATKFPKPFARIKLSVYTEILQKLTSLPFIRTVSLHSYNEPTIDPNFIFYVKELVSRNLRLRLYTNGTGLTEDIVSILYSLRAHIDSVVVNYPSADLLRFHEKTGSGDYYKTTDAIRVCSKAGLAVSLSIQGNAQEYAKEILSARELFPDIPINAYHTTNRAGLMKDLPPRVQTNVPCPEALTALYFDWKGNLYACCHDYHKETVYGNIRDGNLEDVLSSSLAKKMRGTMLGLIPAADDFLCSRCIKIKEGYPRDSRI